MQNRNSNLNQDERTGQYQRRFRAWGVGIVLLLLVTYVPLTRAMDLGPIYTRNPEGGWSVRNHDLRHWRGLRWNWAMNSEGMAQSSGSHFADKNFPTPYPARRIWVVCQTPGRAIQALGEELVQELLANEDMVEVALFPHVQLPITEYRPPDLWIVLDQVEDHSMTLPGHFSAEGSVVITVTPRLLANLDTSLSEIPAPFFYTLLHYTTSRIGLISAAGRWKHIGEQLASHSRLVNYLKKLRGEDTGLSASLTIDLLHGPIPPEPIQALADLGTDVQQIKEGPAWMAHDLSAWSLKPGKDRQLCLANLREQLIAEGWVPVSSTPQGFRVELEQRILTVGSLVNPKLFGDGQTLAVPALANSPIGIQHFHPFSTEECLKFLNQRLAQGLTPAQLHALLAQLSATRRQHMLDQLTGSGSGASAANQRILQQLREPKLKSQQR